MIIHRLTCLRKPCAHHDQGMSKVEKASKADTPFCVYHRSNNNRIPTERCVMDSITIPFTIQLPEELPFVFSLQPLIER